MREMEQQTVVDHGEGVGDKKFLNWFSENLHQKTQLKETNHVVLLKMTVVSKRFYTCSPHLLYNIKLYLVLFLSFVFDSGFR